MNRTDEPDQIAISASFMRVAMGLVVVHLILFAISLPGYKIGVDEAWLGEQAFYLATEGVVRSEMSSTAEYEQTPLVVYHKLHIWLGAAVIKVAGLNLTAMRFITILSGLLLFWLVYRYLIFSRQRVWPSYLIFMAILWSTPIFFERLHYYRPEMLVAASGFASYYFLAKFLATKSSKALFVAGCLAGLATLGHLSGLIFVLAGGGLLISKGQIKGMTLFALGSLFVMMFYLVDSSGDLGQLVDQFTYSQGDRVRDMGLSAPITNLLSEHKRLFRSPEIASISTLFLLSLIDLMRRRRFWRDPINLYTILIIISLGLAGDNKTAKYGVLLFPFFAIVIGTFVERIIRPDRREVGWLSYFTAAILVVHLSLGLGYNAYHTATNREKAEDRHAQVASLLKPGAKVVAPMKFMYNQIENFDIRGFIGLRLDLDDPRGKLNFESTKQLAYQSGVDYILLDTEYDAVWYPSFREAMIQNDSRYELTDSMAGYLIFTRSSDSSKTQ